MKGRTIDEAEANKGLAEPLLALALGGQALGKLAPADGAELDQQVANALPLIDQSHVHQSQRES